MLATKSVWLCEECRESCGTRAFHHCFFDFEVERNGFFDLLFVDDDDVIDEFATDRFGDRAWVRDRDAFGDRRSAHGLRAALQRVRHARVAFDLYADDANLRPTMLDRDCATRDLDLPAGGTTGAGVDRVECFGVIASR